MEKINIVFNIITYLSLFIIFFNKVTDKQKRKKIIHLAYSFAMLFSLFAGFFMIRNYYHLFLLKNVFIFIISSFTNVLFIVFLTFRISKDECDTNTL